MHFKNRGYGTKRLKWMLSRGLELGVTLGHHGCTIKELCQPLVLKTEEWGWKGAGLGPGDRLFSGKAGEMDWSVKVIVICLVI